MAVDTRDKRASAILPAVPWCRVWPNVDGAITGADFEHTGYLYRGIAAGAPVTSAGGYRLLLMGVGSWLLFLCRGDW